jgi:transposase
MELYCGIDLHSTNSYVVVADERDRAVFQRRLTNDLGVILRALAPFAERLAGVVVESTYNWYWLVDGLQEAGFRVHLANPAAIQQYDGLKYTDDRSDAAWLARLRRLGVLPEGYIYPKAERGLRDLLRRRGQLVRQRTANLLAIQTEVMRSTGFRLSAERIKGLETPEVAGLVGEGEVALSIASSLAVLRAQAGEIAARERVAVSRARPRPGFELLQTVGGIGKVLALTILLETGDIARFAGPGNFASYCRCVASKRISNAKKKGEGNRKCGNKHLAWAFVEAAHFAIRYEPRAERFHARKKAKTNAIVARKALAHKLARACYYVMRDQVAFSAERCFG